MWDPSRVCNLHHSSRQRWILNPLSKARDQTCNLMVPSWITYKVSISGNKVELTCPEDPGSEKIIWEKNDVRIHEAYENYMLLDSFSEVENSGYYTCRVGEKKRHKLYLKARVCENCMEVDLMAVVTIIIVDICITLGLLLVVYYYSKSRKAKAMPVTRGAGAGGRPRGKTMEEIPARGNPIRKGQRDLYAGLNQRGR
uniref:T-cell surface glycoprotein CD3 epsilon chain n=1 Tax=Catagonus wagneri TaxID=51154 RepID=A0A8C3VX33_9CETA